ncbi:T9SS type A sorting domain-containing protein [Candidatus Latescibacterota bacterium]
MNKLLFFALILTLVATQSFGQAWVPTPLVIDVQDVVEYLFDGSGIDIPFSLAGKTAVVYLVVNTMLDDSEKPVALWNGFRGWHYVNGIDTTVYVSAGRGYDPSATNTFPWDGHGSEKDMELLVDSGVVEPGTYWYGLIGYDNKSSRECMSSTIAIGNEADPQMGRFYPYDDETGALMNQPLLMGGVWHNRNERWNDPEGITYKFRVGDDPYDVSVITTTLCFGFERGDIVADRRLTQSSYVFQFDDYNTFYFAKSRSWEMISTVTKWDFVPGGYAVQDISWGDFDNVEWYQANIGDLGAGMLNANDEVMMWTTTGRLVDFQTDRIVIFPWDDPSDELVSLYLDEFWMPNVAPDTVAKRMVGESGKLTKSFNKWQWGNCGDVTCIQEVIDISKILYEDSNEPWTADGSGYAVWCNSNGDFFADKNSHMLPGNPAQLWACHAWEPRCFDTQRTALDDVDMNGFQLMHVDFAGLWAGGFYTQDGSAIDYIKWGDETFSTGGDNQNKKNYGESLDVGGTYDGIYVMAPLQAEPGSDDVFYDGCFWIAWDSDSGIITSEPVAVEDDAPAAFSVAQNSPNPFNPSTTISFSLARDGQVTVDVYNIAGQKVDTLVNDFMTTGSHSVVWDASGQAVGVYFYTVSANDFSKTMKMMLLK